MSEKLKNGTSSNLSLKMNNKYIAPVAGHLTFSDYQSKVSSSLFEGRKKSHQNKKGLDMMLVELKE